MHQKLSQLQIDKERFESELRRMGTHSKNKQQIQKRQELEFDIEVVTKNIQSVKSKLRELKAFRT